jgi:hypothetical protein
MSIKWNTTECVGFNTVEKTSADDETVGGHVNKGGP